jgi:hypothetical protein
MKDDSRGMGQFQAKRGHRGGGFSLKFFKNLTFRCSLGKFLLTENFSSIVIKSPLLNG